MGLFNIQDIVKKKKNDLYSLDELNINGEDNTDQNTGDDDYSMDGNQDNNDDTKPEDNQETTPPADNGSDDTGNNDDYSMENNGDDNATPPATDNNQGTDTPPADQNTGDDDYSMENNGDDNATPPATDNNQPAAQTNDDTGSDDDYSMENNGDDNNTDDGGTDDDNYDLPDDGVSSDNGTDSTGNDTTGTDDNSGINNSTDGGDDDYSLDGSNAPEDGGEPQPKKDEDLKNIEAELFSNLSPEQIAVRDLTLKKNYSELYVTLDQTLSKLMEAPRTIQNTKVLEYVIREIVKLKDMVNFSIVTGIELKTYTENLEIYNMYLAVLTTLNKIIEDVSTNPEE